MGKLAIRNGMPLVASGVSQTQVADDLGIKAWMLQRWYQNARQSAGSGASPRVLTPRLLSASWQLSRGPRDDAWWIGHHIVPDTLGHARVIRWTRPGD
jgi:hypothetical protein